MLQGTQLQAGIKEEDAVIADLEARLAVSRQGYETMYDALNAQIIHLEVSLNFPYRYLDAGFFHEGNSDEIYFKKGKECRHSEMFLYFMNIISVYGTSFPIFTEIMKSGKRLSKRSVRIGFFKLL